MSEIIVVEPSSKLAEKLGSQLGEHAGVTWTSAEAPDAALMQRVPELRVIVIGPGVSADAALEFGHAMAEARPDVGTLLVAREVGTELLKLALRYGLFDVVAASEDDLADLKTAVDAALERSFKLRPSAGPEGMPGRTATVLTVVSTKGGVGKSVVASNVAVALAQADRSTVLVDLDLNSGDVGLMLGLKPTRTIADAAMDFERLDREMLKGFLVQHSSGVYVLLAPPHLDDVSVVSVDRVYKILNMLANMFEFVVVDTASVIDDVVLTAIDQSDLVYVVATPDVTSVKGARMALQRLQSLGRAGEGVRLLLNRADSRVWLDPTEVERAVGLQISARVPSNKIVPRCSNKGVPVVSEAPNSAVARSLRLVAAQLTAMGGAS